MGPNTRNQLLAPVLIIAIGVVWLLNVYEFVPGVDWIWTGGLAISGVLLLVLSGVNRFTFTVGFFLIIGSVFSIIRQTGRIAVDVEVPILVIIFGVLLLLSHLLKLPFPAYLEDDHDSSTPR